MGWKGGEEWRAMRGEGDSEKREKGAPGIPGTRVIRFLNKLAMYCEPPHSLHEYLTLP